MASYTSVAAMNGTHALTDAVNVHELLARVEELETAISTAIKVNKHLNVEIEKYIVGLDKAQGERHAWERHAKLLAKRLARLRKAEATADEDEILAQLVERQEAEEQPSTSGMQLQPSPAQTKLMAALIARGKAAGWLIHAGEVELGEVLGEGAFGTTYQGRWRGAKVAVKCVRIAADNELSNFLREVEALCLLRHPHIMPFLGACIQAPNYFWLVCEFMDGGTLSQWLHKGSSMAGSGVAVVRPRPFVERLKMAYQVAQGMQALESFNPPILHRDLKPSNIFVDGAGNARIGDFGLARRLVAESRASLTGETGTYLYMSPEVMRHEVYDAKADVWSWGVLFVELLTCQLPYAHTYLTPVQIALAVAEEQLQPEVPDTLPADLQVIGKLACEFDPEARPTFALITAELAPVLAKLEQRVQQSSSLLGQLKQNLTSSWSTVLGRIYGTTTKSSS